MPWNGYEIFLASTIVCCWFYFLHILRSMTWDHPHDARNLAAHCSRYALPEDAFSEVEPLTSGNAHVVSTASLRGHKGKIILKRWHGSSVSDSERRLFTERLINDLDRWRALERHPNILPVLGVALHISNLPALVVPCYPTAKEVLKKDVDRLVDVLPLLQDVASGLSFLHSSSPTIAHGDIKASTILLRPRTNVKSHKPQYSALLSDIGIASIPQPPDWTFHGVDDARWLAPEIMDPSLRPRSQSDVKYRCNDSDPIGTLSVTPESDVYSLGMLSYEMYSRSPPFSSTVWSAAVVMSVVGGKRPSRPEALTSDAIWMLIECCWKQTWWERPDIKTVSAWLDILGVA